MPVPYLLNSATAARCIGRCFYGKYYASILFTFVGVLPLSAQAQVNGGPYVSATAIYSSSVSTTNVYATGNVGIGTRAPDTTAALDISSTNLVFLPPRMTSTQRDALSSVPSGGLIFNTTDKQFQFANGSFWCNFDGYVVAGSGTTNEAAISQATGSAFGDLSNGGGAAAAFDGTTSQAAGVSAYSVQATNGNYVGKIFVGSPKAITKAIVYGSNNQGYASTNNPTVTLSLMGSNSAPATANDGRVLGTISFTDTSNESGSPRTITVTGIEVYNRYNYVWVSVLSSPAASTLQAVAEVTFYENTAAP